MKKRKVRVYMPKAQEGMEAQGAPQGQPQGGGDQMQQVMQMAQQMAQEGAKPAQIADELTQQGVPEQAVAQVLVQLGVPEKELAQIMQPQQPQQPQGQPMMNDGGEYYDNPVDTGGKLFNEDNFVKTKKKRNGRTVQREISENRFNRIQNRYDRRNGDEENDDYTTVNQSGNKSVSGISSRPIIGSSGAGFAPINSGAGVPSFMNDGGEYHRMPDGTMMPGAYHKNSGGGIVLNGNTIDFDDVRKNLIKMYKKGGETKESDIDPSSIGSYTQGLKNAFEKRMIASTVSGKVRNSMENGTPQFAPIPQQQQMPMAENGILIGEDGIPTWDGEELTQAVKDKYGVETVAQLEELTGYDGEGEFDYGDIVREMQKEIFDTSEYGQRAAEQGYTFDQIAGEGYDPAAVQSMTQAMEPFVRQSQDIGTLPIKELENKDYFQTAPELQDVNIPGYVGGVKQETAPTVISLEEQQAEEALDKKKEEERRAALTQAERDAEDKKNPSGIKAEFPGSYNPLTGEKLTWKEHEAKGGWDAYDKETGLYTKTGTGDATKGQAGDPNRTKIGWNANGSNGGGNGSFLENMLGIVSRRENGVQGNMSPEEFQKSFGKKLRV